MFCHAYCKRSKILSKIQCHFETKNVNTKINLLVFSLTLNKRCYWTVWQILLLYWNNEDAIPTLLRDVTTSPTRKSVSVKKYWNAFKWYSLVLTRNCHKMNCFKIQQIRAISMIYFAQKYSIWVIQIQGMSFTITYLLARTAQIVWLTYIETKLVLCVVWWLCQGCQ